MTGSRVTLRSVSKSYSSKSHVLANLSVIVEPGEFVSIIGRSGVGKSTLLRMVAGLETPTEGSVLIDENEVHGPSGRLGYLVQNYSQSLFPWLTVQGNLKLALHDQGLSSGRAREKIADVMAAVKLDGEVEKYPWQLSGGMQQRVALARALLREPALLLLDEPFASVDALVRLELEDLTRTLVKERSITAILVTHDVEEAIYMADRVIVMAGSPAQIAADHPTRMGDLRHQLSTRDSQNFVSLKSELLSSLIG
jgi:NitT/TauT family transport system ATP-binding protein